MFPFPFALFSKAGTLSQIYKFRVGHERVFFGSFLTLSKGLVGVLSWSWRRKRFNTETRRHRVLNISVSLSLCASRLSRGALRLLRSSLRSPNLIASRQAHRARLGSLQIASHACAVVTRLCVKNDLPFKIRQIGWGVSRRICRGRWGFMTKILA